MSLKHGKRNVFVLLGKDPQYKRIQIDKIKTFLLKEDPTLTLVSFYCQELELVALGRELENLSFSKRLFIFRNTQDASDEVKAYLNNFLIQKKTPNFFLFDFELEPARRQDLEEDSFFSFLFGLSPPYKLASAHREFTLRDLAQAIRRDSQSQSVRILLYLFEKHKPQKISMQILGLVVRLFEQVKDPGEKRRFLKEIFHTDRAIKDGLLNPQTGLEILILKLTGTNASVRS